MKCLILPGKIKADVYTRNNLRKRFYVKEFKPVFMYFK